MEGNSTCREPKKDGGAQCFCIVCIGQVARPQQPSLKVLSVVIFMIEFFRAPVCIEWSPTAWLLGIPAVGHSADANNTKALSSTIFLWFLKCRITFQGNSTCLIPGSEKMDSFHIEGLSCHLNGNSEATVLHTPNACKPSLLSPKNAVPHCFKPEWSLAIIQADGQHGR